MNYIPFLKKIKVLALSVAMFASFAMAGEGNLNYYGQLGVHKTQSAQALGHGRLGIGFFLEGAGLNGTLVEDDHFYIENQPHTEFYSTSKFLGLNLYSFLSLGLSDYFDFSIGIPAYGELFQVDSAGGRTGIDVSAVGQGNLFLSLKFRAPFDNSFPLDFAIIPSFGFNTGRENANRLNDYGPWIRDPMFLYDPNINEPYRVGSGAGSSYTNANGYFKFGIATTFDFNRIGANIPLLFHLNYSNRRTLGTEGSNYPIVQSFSSALEWTPMQYVSLYSEYYTEWLPSDKNIDVDLNTVSVGGSFHLSKHVDLHLGAQIFVGDKGKYVDHLAVNFDNEGNKINYSARLIPDYVAFGGFTIKLFTMDPIVEEVEEEEEEYRNPDTDEDGVCDPWVSEAGRQREFKKTCSGIDLCPYEEGPTSNKGCPEKQAEVAPAPTILFTVSPDVVSKGQSVTLTWQVSNASSIEIEGLGKVEASGSRKVKPTANTTYTLSATGDGGTRESSVEVEIAAGPVPIILFSANPESVQTGHSVSLKWEVTNATEVNIDNGIGKVQLKGSKQVKPTSSIAYTLTATGEGGTKSETVEIEVTEPPPIEARVNLQGVTFGSGNATLTPNAKKVLDGVAEQLLANPKVKIEIQGHTDNQGKPAANQDLSQRRAKSVVGYLATKGVSTSRMKAVGYGQDVPIADNKTAEGRELNRRIEMVRVDD
ncbi:MAG: OmpA family protein [Fibromonadaceae bacterium]|jgi:outer membrane protein OmpA-like peptidoglycan-associated protein|nr:OmpA family protein [Fibromonadaceae bacterium]